MTKAATGRVTPKEVVAWLDRTGAAAPEAVAHFWPHADEEERRRKHDLVRTWRHRAKPQPPKPDDPPPSAPPPHGPEWAPEASAASSPLVEFLAERVANVAGDLAYLRQRGRVSEAAKLEVSLCDLRDRLEAARIAAAGRLHLERSPAAIAAEIERSRRLLDLQLEKERRREARQAAEGAAAQARERAL